MIPLRLILSLSCAIFATGASAHEFWIEPASYQVAPGSNVVATLRNGEEFEGIALSYFDRRIERFDIASGDTLQPVKARMGDNPALDNRAPGPGLTVIVHETTPSILTYKTWEKFQKFADHKDFPDIATRHAANGFPDPPFKERYTRHAKALVAVGDGAGSDRNLGLLTEFTALTNPYATDFDGIMRVELTLEGAARADAQVEVFDRDPDGAVTISLHRTDANGLVAVPVTSGHRYLFDAVTLRPAPADVEAVWDTHWAALTFAVP